MIFKFSEQIRFSWKVIYRVKIWCCTITSQIFPRKIKLISWIMYIYPFLKYLFILISPKWQYILEHVYSWRLYLYIYTYVFKHMHTYIHICTWYFKISQDLIYFNNFPISKMWYKGIVLFLNTYASMPDMLQNFTLMMWIFSCSSPLHNARGHHSHHVPCD